ncbi:glycosyltransferase family 2 protein [Verrucosispora sp. SN26_14.1]|nr:glycosyltransferase family 2 protein [Verrucosispora sp. SN26_14.1]
MSTFAPDRHPMPSYDRYPSLSVVIPARNEARNLPHVFARLPHGVAEVILVDGGSVDGTADVARELWPSVRVIEQTRTGKGNALACGFAAATGDIVVMIDADGSTDPQEIPSFVEALVSGADFAKGTRFRYGGGSDDITPLRRWGNRALNGIVNALFGTRFTDLCYGYNAFWRDLVPAMELPHPASTPPPKGKLWGDGFEIETLINIRMAAAGYQVREVPSIEYLRIHGESNLHTFRDGSRVLRTILSEFRRARRGRHQDSGLANHAAHAASGPAAPATGQVRVSLPRPAPTPVAATLHHAGTAPLGQRDHGGQDTWTEEVR